MHYLSNSLTQEREIQFGLTCLLVVKQLPTLEGFMTCQNILYLFLILQFLLFSCMDICAANEHILTSEETIVYIWKPMVISSH